VKIPIQVFTSDLPTSGWQPSPAQPKLRRIWTSRPNICSRRTKSSPELCYT